MYEYSGFVVKVVDGDTVDIDVDLGFNMWMRSTRFRLARINAYETTLRGDTTPEEKAIGLEAKEFLKKKLINQRVTIQTKVDSKGKYGRYLAEVYLNEFNINDELVELGYAIYQEY